MRRIVILAVVAALAVPACTPESPSPPPKPSPVAFHPTTAPVRWSGFETNGQSLHLATGEEMVIENARDMVISRDGHRIAYLDTSGKRYVALDLRDGRSRHLTRPLTAAEMDERRPGLRPLAASGDGRFFAAAIYARASTIVTDFETGAARTIPKLCVLFGLTSATVIGARECGWDGDIVAIDVKGRAKHVGEYLNANHVMSLSPDGTLLMGCHGLIAFYDAKTGARVRDFPTPGCGEEAQWLDDRHVIIDSTSGFLIVDVTTGALTRARGVPARARTSFGMLPVP
ncbi:hypothetical protein ACQP25_05585 [Microtetraspora malaysiensis]|uniref:hypothetical protein n=1 Tax=Microtetraspora malaysiensis TaxID=161358 RepID=UPI003D8FEC8A